MAGSNDKQDIWKAEGAGAPARPTTLRAKRHSLQGVLARRLLAVVAGTFAIILVVGNHFIVAGEISSKTFQMSDETSWILERYADITATAERVSQQSGAIGAQTGGSNSGNIADLIISGAVKNLVGGYNEENDGIVALVGEDGLVSMANSEKIAIGATLEESLGEDVADTVRECTRTGEVQRLPSGAPYTDRDSYVFAKSQDGLTAVAFKTEDAVLADCPRLMLGMSIPALLVLAVVGTLAYHILKREFVYRVERLDADLMRITEGDLGVKVDVGGTSEFNSLTSSINQTVDALKGWIAEAESRMDSELAAARAIQESAMPRVFPPFPDIPKFDLYASMDAAREVGGDFYDFFLLEGSGAERGRLAFLVADVSGKGVPAALFMMRAKAQLHDYLNAGLGVAEAVSRANAQLLEGNEDCMFVTAWVGVLDYGTHRVEFVNAGHNPPLLWQREGGWRWLEEISGMPLGLFEDAYEAFSIDCEPGDAILLYTDGVTEAYNAGKMLYGSERLMELLRQVEHLHPQKLVEAVRGDVARWAEGAEQSDDVTLLALEIGAPPEAASAL